MRSKRGFPYFDLFLTLCVTGLTLVPSYLALGGVARQLRSMGYPRVQGTIAHSGMVVTRDSDGDPSYRFSVRYVYEVEGRRYEGTEARYSAWSTVSQSVAEELVERFPEKATVPVYYRPGAPGDAVLLKGPQSQDLLMMLVMTPIALAMFGGWYAVTRMLLKGKGMRPFVREGRTHVTLKDTFPFVRGLVASAGCTFLMAIILGVGWGANAPVPAVLAAWVLVIASGVAATWVTRSRLAQGRYDLILDEPRRQLLLPPGPERKGPMELRWQNIAAVKCVPHTFEDSDGVKQHVWRLVLELTGAREPRSEAVVDWSNEDRVEELADWLRSRLGR